MSLMGNYSHVVVAKPKKRLHRCVDFRGPHPQAGTLYFSQGLGLKGHWDDYSPKADSKSSGETVPGLCTLTGPVRAWWGEGESVGGGGGGGGRVVRSTNYMIYFFLYLYSLKPNLQQRYSLLIDI